MSGESFFFCEMKFGEHSQEVVIMSPEISAIQLALAPHYTAHFAQFFAKAPNRCFRLKARLTIAKTRCSNQGVRNTFFGELRLCHGIDVMLIYLFPISSRFPRSLLFGNEARCAPSDRRPS